MLGREIATEDEFLELVHTDHVTLETIAPDPPGVEIKFQMT
jgi:hypothetical protein